MYEMMETKTERWLEFNILNQIQTKHEQETVGCKSLKKNSGKSGGRKRQKHEECMNKTSKQFKKSNNRKE